ncbi:response regulator transcription factor [Bacillus sp. B-jedd]|uniref:response regulator transcription factor n=1 Tax=Bacillus sp. B-jedd TaxID=1476857 RepID=UPI00051560B3|nr:response regulator transcription factor [Bacillus sp. B-jedd]CEG27017.1 winged helix family two component transcriptional regulator [Bacillus sp. B-jedd]
MSHKIAIIEDDAKIARFIKANLQSKGYEAITFPEGELFLEQFALQNPDLVLLDITLPGINGFTVLDRLRKFTNVPVIILTARSNSNDLVEGFELGADDYLTKPFSLDELFARVKAVLRRMSVHEQIFQEESKLSIGSLDINFAQKRVFALGKELRFTHTEYMILEQLALYADKIISHEQLLVSVWGKEYRDEVEYLRVAIARIRKKLKEAGITNSSDLIRTYPGIGYSLVSNTNTTQV